MSNKVQWTKFTNHDQSYGMYTPVVETGNVVLSAQIWFCDVHKEWVVKTYLSLELYEIEAIYEKMKELKDNK